MTGNNDSQNKAGGLRRQAEKIAPYVLEDWQGLWPAAARKLCMYWPPLK